MTFNLEQSDEHKPDATHHASHGASTIDGDTEQRLRRFFAPHNVVRATSLVTPIPSA